MALFNNSVRLYHRKLLQFGRFIQCFGGRDAGHLKQCSTYLSGPHLFRNYSKIRHFCTSYPPKLEENENVNSFKEAKEQKEEKGVEGVEEKIFAKEYFPLGKGGGDGVKLELRQGRSEFKFVDIAQLNKIGSKTTFIHFKKLAFPDEAYQMVDCIDKLLNALLAKRDINSLNVGQGQIVRLAWEHFEGEKFHFELFLSFAPNGTFKFSMQASRRGEKPTFLLLPFKALPQMRERLAKILKENDETRQLEQMPEIPPVLMNYLYALGNARQRQQKPNQISPFSHRHPKPRNQQHQILQITRDQRIAQLEAELAEAKNLLRQNRIAQLEKEILEMKERIGEF